MVFLTLRLKVMRWNKIAVLFHPAAVNKRSFHVFSLSALIFSLDLTKTVIGQPLRKANFSTLSKNHVGALKPGTSETNMRILL